MCMYNKSDQLHCGGCFGCTDFAELACNMDWRVSSRIICSSDIAAVVGYPTASSAAVSYY